MLGATAEGVARRHRWTLGFGYIFAISVCGMVLVALGSTLEDLATACDTTATEIGTVFIARGGGVVLGAVSSSKMYRCVRGNTVLFLALMLQAVVLAYVPFISSVTILHLAFCALGLLTAVIDTGCQIMTRKVHGDKARPWIGANIAAMGIAGIFVPLIGFLAGSVLVQYVFLAVVSCLASTFLVILPAAEGLEGFMEEDTSEPPSVPAVEEQEETSTTNKILLLYQKYRIEFHISGMVFWLIGGRAGATAYLDAYVDFTGVIPESQEGLLIVDLWTAIVVGLVIGQMDQLYFDLPCLYQRVTITFLCGAAAAAAIFVFKTSAYVLWTGVAAYGLFNGPTIGYCYDLNNRVDVASETGMSVVMFGTNFGSCVVPYGLSLELDYAYWPESLLVLLVLSHILPYPLMLNVKRIASANEERDLRTRGDSSATSTVGEETPLLLM